MNYVVIGAFVFTISIFAFGAGTIAWAYVGELLPADGTGFVVGAASFTNWFVSFFLAFYYSPMQVKEHSKFEKKNSEKTQFCEKSEKSILTDHFSCLE